MSNMVFWSKANFFSAYAVAGIIEGVCIGIGFAIGYGLLFKAIFFE